MTQRMLDAPGHILVVDDSRQNRLKLSLGLRRHGHTVGLAEDGQQALRMLAEDAYDLVLLDILMPGMDGYEVLDRMKNDKELRNIPVIVISALDQLDSVVKGIELGAEDYLPKTFDPVLLKARICASLEKKRLRDQEAQYLRQVARLTDAAAAVNARNFDPASLDDVAARTDRLGELARVFQQMAREVYRREELLRQQVQTLSIKIDEARTARKVDEITQTDYFQELERKAELLRR
jgi:DNA-binding response OmpR family regulator